MRSTLALGLLFTSIVGCSAPQEPEKQTSAVLRLTTTATGHMEVSFEPNSPPSDPEGTVTGRVVDAHGNPVVGAAVLGGPFLGSLTAQEFRGSAGALTDNDGRFVLAIPKGSSVSLVAAKSHGGLSRVRTTAVGTDTELVLEPVAWLTGTIEDPNAPTGRTLSVWNEGLSMAAEVDASGRFQVGPLPAGAYNMRPLMLGGTRTSTYPTATVELTPGLVTTHDVVETGTASVTVDFEVGAKERASLVGLAMFEGDQAVASSEQYRALEDAQGMMASAWSRNGKGGSTTFVGLEPGRYTACGLSNVADQGLVPSCAAVEVRQHEDVSLSPPAAG